MASVLAEAPPGANPYKFAEKTLLHELANPLVPWSKPVCLALSAIFFLSLLGTTLTFVLKWRKDQREERSFWYFKMQEHPVSGQKFICPNASNVFLVGNIVSSAVIGCYMVLHVTAFRPLDQAWKDLVFSSMVWLLPIINIWLSTLGSLFGVLIAPPALSAVVPDANGKTPRKRLVKTFDVFSNATLFNILSIAVPASFAIAIIVTGGFLIKSVERTTSLGLELADAVNTLATQWDQGGNSAINFTLAFKSLDTYHLLSEASDVFAQKWDIHFAVWIAFLGFLLPISFLTFYLVRTSIGKQVAFLQSRKVAAPVPIERPVSPDYDEKEKPKEGESPISVFTNRTAETETADISAELNNKDEQLLRLKKTYYNLCFQFGSIAIGLCGFLAVLLYDVILGTNVHLNGTLLALGVVIPGFLYAIMGSTTVLLIFLRLFKYNKQPTNRTATPISPKGRMPLHGGIKVDFQSFVRRADDLPMEENDDHKYGNWHLAEV